jgi:hypothetical protein
VSCRRDARAADLSSPDLVLANVLEYEWSVIRCGAVPLRMRANPPLG